MYIVWLAQATSAPKVYWQDSEWPTNAKDEKNTTYRLKKKEKRVYIYNISYYYNIIYVSRSAAVKIDWQCECTLLQ